MTSAHVGSGTAQALGANAQSITERPIAVLATCVLASSLTFIDETVVDVGRPA